jgi:uncharacterized protein
MNETGTATDAPVPGGGQAVEQAAQLFTAIAAHDERTARELVAAAPDLASARNPAGVSAVLWARYHQQRDLAAELAAAKGELDIFEAAAQDHGDRVRELVAADPALVSAYSPDGFHPLGLAAFFGAPAAVRILLDAGAGPDQVATNAMRVTALHAAVATDRTDIVQVLLDAGANPNLHQQGGWTPLHQAVHHDNETIEKALLAAGADPDARNDDGARPADLRPKHG